MSEKNRYGYVVMGIIVLASVSFGGIWSSCAVFATRMMAEMSFNYIMFGGLISVMLLPLAGFTRLIKEPLKDRGAQFGLSVGIGFIGGFGTLQAFCPDYWTMLVARFLVATGFGIIFLFNNLIVMSFFGMSNNSNVAGTLSVMTGLVWGAFSASYYSGLLYFALGASWRMASAFWGVIGIVAAILWILLGKESPLD